MSTSDLERNFDQREAIQPIHFRCQGCGIHCQAAVMDYSPIIAKHKCRRCGYVNEVQTRTSAYDAIEEHVEEGKDKLKVAKRHSIVVP